MAVNRLKRVNELIKREIAGCLFRMINEREIDISAVTITRVVVSNDLRNARVLVSVRDQDEDKHRVLAVLRRHARSIQQHLRKHLVMKYIPHLSFELDESIHEGDRILDIIAKLEQENPTTEEPGDGSESEEI